MKRPKKKINTIDYGGKWIGLGLLIGLVIPFLIWLVFHTIVWILCLIGGVILGSFVLVFLVEMHQDNSEIPFFESSLKETIPFDPKVQTAIVKSSICTGEAVAGFKNKTDGHFTEVMLIRNDADLQRFKAIYEIETVKKEY